MGSRAFGLRPEAAPSEELRRVLLAQIDLALRALAVDLPATSDDPAVHEGVHQARRCVKRIRATVRLAAGALVEPARLDHGLRDAARVLGPIRDDHVMRETAARLGVAGPPGPPPDPGPPLAAATGALRHWRAVVSSLDLEPVTVGVVCEGLEKGHRKARKALGRASGTGDPEEMHDLRKAVKTHGAHLSLLRDVWPLVLEPLEVHLDALQKHLGDHHDLWVLTSRVGRAEGWEEREAQLREEALTLGAEILLCGARPFARLVRSAWDARRAGVDG